MWNAHGFTFDPGKQKFEILTIQFPCCESSATLQNRILFLGLDVGQVLHEKCRPISRIGRLMELRCAIINTDYSRTTARSRVLELLAWSFNALGFPADQNQVEFTKKNTDPVEDEQKTCRFKVG